MATVFLGLGSNVEPHQNLRLAISELQRRYGALEISNVYENAAVGFEGPDFLNLVVRLNSDESPADMHSQIESIHDLAGRERGEEKFIARPLDIDLLLYDDLVLDEFDVAWVKVRVNKPGAIRGARDVGVLIERGVKPGKS